MKRYTSYTRVCQWCGKSFVRYKPQKYCSTKCSWHGVRAERPPVRCAQCGKETIATNGKKYCSTKCRDAAKWLRVRDSTKKKRVEEPKLTSGFWSTWLP